MPPARVEPPATPTPAPKETINGTQSAQSTKITPITVPATITATSTAASSPIISRSISYSFRSNANGSASGGAMEFSSLSFIRNVAQTLEKKGTAELGFGVWESISRTTFIELVQWIANERRSSLPHRGSTWDDVLLRALYFAERNLQFERMIKSFGAEDHTAANLAYGYCKLLLELGHENARALDKAFGVLYKYALEVAALQQRLEVVQTTPQIREELSLMYGDLLTLTSTVATRFYKVTHGIASVNMSLDIYEICGSTIQSFREHKEKVIDLIWQHQASLDGFDMTKGVSARALRAWLVSMDPVQTSLTQDHTILLAGQAEFTCLWFTKQLSPFVQGDSKVMAVTGHQGSGKSILAASVVERLQRAIGRKSFSTLYYAINSDLPAATTTISILKSLLSQILDLRVGNMQTYRAIAHAYEHSHSAGDLKIYEEHLWGAFDEALKKPLDNARDLVIVVDGLDEIQGGKPAAQAFFERLAEVVCDGKRVKLIGLAETLSMPSGINTTHVAITREHVQEDIHAVILRALHHSHFLHSKQGVEQEVILDRIARTANGSFVWAILVSYLLSHTKNADEFHKTFEEFEKSQPSIEHLVQRLVGKQDLHHMTKMFLGWLIHAERPLTIYDIHELYAHGPKHDHDVDIVTALEPLSPVLIEENTHQIKRFRHRSILHSIISLVNGGKIHLHDESKHHDLLIRGLRYAKTVLRDDHPPTLEEVDLVSVERSLREYSLLPYVVRYWVVHLRRTGNKQPKELSQVLPTTTMLSLVERAVWNHEIPLVETIDLYLLAATVRQSHLKEPSPAALQSTLNLALIYDILGKHSDAAKWYYWSTKTSHSLQYDVLSTEVGHRFLRVSDSYVEAKRTEIMSYREEIYIVLIAILIKEHGSSSTEVVQMRTLLAQFYEHIQEKSRAAEIYERIHEATVHIHGKDSTQARGIQDHLTVKLGRTKTEEKIETRKESIFDEVDEVETDRALDIVTVNERLKTAKTEREFVELWQQVSMMARSTTAVEWHEKNIEAAMAYGRFLQTNKRTEEASAVLTSVSREYESHQATFSDVVVTRLSETATFLRELGQTTAALSILTAAAYFFRSLKREHTSQHTEIQRQISSVETELIQSSSHTHGDTLEQVYINTVKDQTRAVDSKLFALAKTLAAQHMEHYQPDRAIEIITLLLARVWPTFLTAPTNEVQMTTTLPKETIELILEYLVVGYQQLRKQQDVERTLLALFNAALTASTLDFALINRVQVLLLEQYDKHHQLDKSIAALQKALPVRRTHQGTTHEDTIKTLYELGRRSRQRPRTYPGWIDFYQQIVTYLNKDRETCTANAMDALIIVATTYWEDGRYHDAVHYYGILWKTFTKEAKQHSRFTQTEFVQQLYERYYQCLEQTSVRIEVLYELTKEYRTTCIAVFGAQSEITTRATLSLARVSYSSEAHAAEAIALYEEVSKHSGSVTVHRSEIHSALTTLYTRQITRSTSTTTTTTSAATIESARARSFSEYQSSASKFGYSNTSTLTHLHEVILLWFKQNKTEAAHTELTKATVEVITKEKSSRKMIEAAESIVVSFTAISGTAYLTRLVEELYRQIIRKDTTNTKAWGFDLTKYGRSVLPFLAAMICKMSTDVTISFSQTMANLITEMMYFDEYRTLVKSNESLQHILLSASRIRIFLLSIKRTDAVASLDDEIARLFITRDGSKMKLLSQHSARIFMVAIMEYIGVHRRAPFIKAVVLASNAEVAKLMLQEKYAEAYDIANCEFEFALENEGYSGTKGIAHGFALASGLAGIGYAKKCSDANLRKQMLHLSNTIAKKILGVCRRQGIKFTEIQLSELNRIVELLGVQEDYETLDGLLSELWASREAHRDWNPTTLHNLSKDLIYARYLGGHPIKALRLCEDIAYNLRRTDGAMHPVTREMNTLLAELYTGTGQYYLQQGAKDKTNADLAHQYFVKAFNVHDEMLRLLVHKDIEGSMGDDDDWDSTGAILAEHGIATKIETNGSHAAGDEAAIAKIHLHLLKLAYQRLGAWPGPYAEDERLVRLVQEKYASTKDVGTSDKWQIKGFGSGKAESNDGSFTKIEKWSLIEV